MKGKLCGLFALLFLLVGVMPIEVYANSAQPPALVIIMKNAPEDAAVSLLNSAGSKEADKTQTAWETYFVFYYPDVGTSSEVTLKVSGNGTEYGQKVGAEYLQGYDSIITLDFAAQTIKGGKLLSRSILLVSMRVLLTLVIEGLVFLLFGFREKRSWMIFLLMNLLTQGWLNISLNGGWPLGIYMMTDLIMMEFLVFVAEAAGVLVLIKEHSRLRRVVFVVVANLLSLILGGCLITVLPV